MAAKLDPLHVRARHQSMHHFVATAPWSAGDVLRVARDSALAQMERHAPPAAWVVDDTGMPKKGSLSVGVAHQYCGALGKGANCQVAVTVSLVNPVMSVPCCFQLYLPEAWAKDSPRQHVAGVPSEIPVSDQVGDRAGADRRAVEGLSCSGAGGGGCWLWRNHGLPRWVDEARPLLCSRDLGRDESLASWRRAAATTGLERPRPSTSTVAPRRGASGPDCQGACSASAASWLENSPLARGNERDDDLPLRRSSGSRRPWGPPTRRAARV